MVSVGDVTVGSVSSLSRSDTDSENQALRSSTSETHLQGSGNVPSQMSMSYHPGTNG